MVFILVPTGTFIGCDDDGQETQSIPDMGPAAADGMGPIPNPGDAAADPDASAPAPADAESPAPAEAGAPNPGDASSPSVMDAASTVPVPVDASSPAPMDASAPNPMDAALPNPMDAVPPNPMDAAPAVDAAAPGEPVRLFLMAGQSNMEGYGPIAAADVGDWAFSISLETLLELGEEAPRIQEPRDDVWVAFPHGDNRREAGLLAPGFGANPSFIGPELGMGEVLGTVSEAPIIMYKAAHGGTTLGADWRPPSAGGETGPLFQEMIDGFRAYRDDTLATVFPEEIQARGVELAGFVWLQGWNDQFEDGFVAQYEDNLVHLITDVRAVLERPDLPVIIVEGPTLQEELRAARRAAIARLDGQQPGRTVFVETEDLVEEEIPGNFHFHFSARNYLEVGRRTAEAILEFLR